jgi:hypothetical protein
MASERVNKQKRVVLTIATKLRIIGRAENGESISKLAAELNIGNQTVCDIIKKKDELHKFVTLSDSFMGHRIVNKKSAQNLKIWIMLCSTGSSRNEQMVILYQAHC